jgi:hypothetical protein
MNFTVAEPRKLIVSVSGEGFCVVKKLLLIDGKTLVDKDFMISLVSSKALSVSVELFHVKFEAI